MRTCRTPDPALRSPSSSCAGAPNACDSPALFAVDVSDILHNLMSTATVRCQGWLSNCLRNPNPRTIPAPSAEVEGNFQLQPEEHHRDSSEGAHITPSVPALVNQPFPPPPLPHLR